MHDSLFRAQLGELIRERRQLLGLTQHELADRIPIRESTTISRWERGERAPQNLHPVARALETTAEEMLSAISSVKQADRRHVEPGGETQLDRIEQMLALLVYRQSAMERIPAPGGELGHAAEGSDPNARGQKRRRHPPAADAH